MSMTRDLIEDAKEETLEAWIQNVANPRGKGRIVKVFELVEQHFRRDVERDFHIRPIFPYRDRNYILNP